MPIDLSKPLAWKSADIEERKLLQRLQGNILKGHGRETTANIFFTFGTDVAASKRMLRELGNYHVTSTWRQLLEAEKFKASNKCDSGGAFVHVALSHTGYQALELADVAPLDVDFRNSMANVVSREALKDGELADWEERFRDPIDAVVLAAHDNVGKTAELDSALRAIPWKSMDGALMLNRH